MYKPRQEHSLRNEHVGQAYMLMLDVCENCGKAGMSPEDILVEIERVNPWRSSHEWLQQAWDIALREISKDCGLPHPRREHLSEPA